MIAYINKEQINKLARELKGKQIVCLVVEDNENIRDDEYYLSAYQFSLTDLKVLTFSDCSEDATIGDFIVCYTASLFDFEMTNYVNTPNMLGAFELDDDEKDEPRQTDCFQYLKDNTPMPYRFMTDLEFSIIVLEDEELKNISKLFGSFTKQN